MGTFTHTITLIGPSDGGPETLEALVDTGAAFTVIPAPIREHLGVRPFRTVPVHFANGHTETWPMGEVQAEIDGH